ARARARRLRADPGPVHPLRAARHLRPLDEDQALLLAVPALQAGHLQAPEDLHALGAPSMTLFEAHDLAINFGGVRALDGVSFAAETGHVVTIMHPHAGGKTPRYNLV